jgi:hypothetical protein
MNKRRRYKAKARRAAKQCKCFDPVLVAQAIHEYLARVSEDDKLEVISSTDGTVIITNL